jgi:pimeloyl-ACP methyl ester carboxylesterase
MESCSTPPSAGDEVVSSDGVRLAGWYVPAAGGIGPTGPTIVIAPGWTSSKSEVLKYAPPFHEAFNLVLVDLRDQGRSDRASVSWGINERHDVRAMVDWLVEHKHPSWIGAMGNSMGAISVLAAAVDDPRIEALILDSMQASIVAAVGQGLERENGQPAVPGSWAAVTGLSLRLGTDVTQVDPVRTIARLGDRPVLLIHGTADVLDVPAQASEPNFHAALEAGVPVELQYCPGGTHGQLIEACPAEWARWAQSFLEGATD